MIPETKRRLVQARRDGADRIYGWPVQRDEPAPRAYVLRVTDGSSKVYFERRLLEASYFAAVVFWMSLEMPGESMFWRRDVA
jgi:hypothetical protein